VAQLEASHAATDTQRELKNAATQSNDCKAQAMRFLSGQREIMLTFACAKRSSRALGAHELHK
jgi:hypothetical protein